jgi:hypothetical protein
MLFFWYCIDDYVAGVAHAPELGHVPWWVVLVLHLLIIPFLRARVRVEH